MDSNGIPKKINRHVLKAVMQSSFEGCAPRFNSIYDFVHTCNKNLNPVPNMKELIRRSLNNFVNAGVIERDASYRYFSKVPAGSDIGGSTQSILSKGKGPSLKKQTKRLNKSNDIAEETRKRFSIKEKINKKRIPKNKNSDNRKNRNSSDSQESNLFFPQGIGIDALEVPPKETTRRMDSKETLNKASAKPNENIESQTSRITLSTEDEDANKKTSHNSKPAATVPNIQTASTERGFSYIG